MKVEISVKPLVDAIKKALDDDNIIYSNMIVSTDVNDNRWLEISVSVNGDEIYKALQSVYLATDMHKGYGENPGNAVFCYYIPTMLGPNVEKD